MACEDYLKFKGITNIGNVLLMNELENNLKSFFDWAMLQGVGAWQDVDMSVSDVYTGDFSVLRAVKDGSYTDGQVWQGARKDWVWETGVNYVVPKETGEVYQVSWFAGGYHQINMTTDPSLIVQSGDVLRIAGTSNTGLNTDYSVFNVVQTGVYNAYSNATSGVDAGGGTYQVLKNPQPVQVKVDGVVNTEYYINYPLGQVVFNTPVATSSTVQASYSYRYVQIYNADSLPWWQELQFTSLRADDTHFTQTGDYGEWSIGGQHRIQLPAIIIEAIPRGTSKGYQLGDGALVVNQDVLFHVLAEDRFTRNNLLDACRLQNHKTIWLYNSNNVSAANGFPLDYRGMKVGNNMYPDLVDSDGYRWEKCYFNNAVVSAMETPNPKLYAGVVRITTEIIFRE